MRTITTIIGLVLGGLAGAYIGIHKGTELLLKYKEFGSPDDASLGNHVMMMVMMGIVGLVGAILGLIVGRLLFKH